MGKITDIESAIKHCEEVAESYEQQVKNETWVKGSFSELRCIECASEHRQLAEWLRELKQYRIAHYKLRDMDYEYDLNSKFGNNPMYYGHKVWDVFGDIDIDEHQDEVMGYEEVNADGKIKKNK